MALSQHGKVTILPLAVVLMLLFAGAAEAWNCAVGQKDCNGCINPLTDVNNCGGCGVKCSACGNGVPSCSAGKCGFTCNAPYKNCDNSWANGCEVDTSKDVNNCGACGTKCIAPPNASAKCYMGICEYTCNAGWKNCDGKWENGCETDGSKDVNNCGGCGKKCSAAAYATPKCYMGQCQNTCKPGYSNCDNNWMNGCECNTDSDNNNCGACGAKCKDVANAVSVCKGKQCVYSCKAGWANCDYDWTNGCECAPYSDVNHCGGCGNKCSQPKYYGGEARCTNGKCETQSCKSGMKYDGGKKCCVNGDGGYNGGNNGSDNGGNRGGNNGGDKGGSWGGDKGGDKGGSKGGMGGRW